MNDFFKNISSGLDELATIKREKPSPYRGELFFGAAREITVVYFDKEIKFSISNKNTPDLS
ncbi:MAG: hypothetical protein LUC34_04535, partial [Campylobacter sp.]|nr:hypothetical protein [Campylobacter sp.]